MEVEREQYVHLQRTYDLPDRPGVRLAVPNLFEPWMVAVAQSFCALADAGGLATRISVTRHDAAAEYAAAALCETNDECGLVIADPSAPLGPIAELCRVAVLGRGTANENVACFSVDDVQGMGMLMRHLLGKGHEAVTYVAAAPRPCPRESTYLDQMYRSGLAAHARLIDCAPELTPASLAEAILDHPSPPTAVVASNDYTAMRVIDAFRATGVSVPGDIAVVGFGNVVEPTEGLTTIDGRVDRLVTEAVAWITASTPAVTRVFVPHLVLRHTT